MRCFGDVTVDLSEQIEKEKRVKDGKRPKGRVAKDTQDSKAVAGNVILQEGGKYSDTDEKVAERLMLEEQIKMARTRRHIDKPDQGNTEKSGEKPKKSGRQKSRKRSSRNRGKPKNK